MRSQFQNKEELKALLQQFSIHEIARNHKVTLKTVYFAMARLGITTPKKRDQGHPWARREKHWHWKDGRTLNGSGYVIIHMPEHPNANMSGYVLEHRLVKERDLNRRLKPWEKVHHVNRIKTDNRVENLRIMSNPHHGEAECPRCNYKFLIH